MGELQCYILLYYILIVEKRHTDAIICYLIASQSLCMYCDVTRSRIENNLLIVFTDTTIKGIGIRVVWTCGKFDLLWALFYPFIY